MKCIFCNEELESDILDDLVGMIQEAVSHQDVLPVHPECSIRMYVGSLGHQLGVCSCPGSPGLMDDPPGITRRQAAQAAAAFLKARNGS